VEKKIAEKRSAQTDDAKRGIKFSTKQKRRDQKRHQVSDKINLNFFD
jgi:hypothetical protein